MIAKAALAQFEDADVVRHFWPMVRSRQHLDRIMGDITANPGLVLFTLVNSDIRTRLEEHCRALGLPSVPALDTVTDALEDVLGQEAKGKPGRQHLMDDAYFARVEAIQFTIAHDDGVAWEDWEEADIVLVGRIVDFRQRVISEDDRDRVRESSATTTVRIEIRDGRRPQRILKEYVVADRAEFFLARGENHGEST